MPWMPEEIEGVEVMQRTKIEWADYTWNPTTGCLHGCEFCYARRIDKRFGDGKFQPIYHSNRIYEPLHVKKPSKIFVGSMTDLFGDWWWLHDYAKQPMSGNTVLENILIIADKCPQHTFIFLTKNPKGMQGIKFPKNCWCGTSFSDQEGVIERLPELAKVNCNTLLASYEPALGRIDMEFTVHDMPHPDNEGYGVEAIKCLDWIIVGAQTGPGAVKPKAEWIDDVIMQAEEYGIPLFIKDNVKWSEKRQSWPEKST